MPNFFDLPGEIRNQIYTELITPTATATATKPIPLKHCAHLAHLTPKTAASTIHAQFVGLSQANQQLRHEFWPLLWSALSYSLCDCHSHTLDYLEHFQIKHLRTASATGHVFLPPMLTGPHALGCGRVAKLVYGGRKVTHLMADWFRSPVELGAQLAAVLVKLEFRGELRVGYALPHHIKLLGELLGRVEARMRDPGVASFKKAVGGMYGDWEFLWMCVVEDAAWRVEYHRRRGLAMPQWSGEEDMAQMVEEVVEVDFAGLAEEERFLGLVVPDVRDRADRTFNGSFGWLTDNLRLL